MYTNAAPLHVVGISGSIRTGSYNTGLLRAAAEMLPSGMRLELLSLAELPLYNQDLEEQGDPPSVAVLRERIAAADALLIACPEYNYSITGVLKNAIDWASRPAGKAPLTGKPAAIIGAGGRFGTVRAQLHLRQICTHLTMPVLLSPEFMVARAWECFDQHGNLTDLPTRERLHEVLVALERWARLFV
jgi:chromate reductase